MSYEQIPQELKALPQWVNWGAVGETIRKKPYNPSTASAAKASDPDTWTTFDLVCAGVSDGVYEGIGFEFNGNGIVGIDFDHCFQDGQLSPWVAAWVERIGSYTEVSPSGDGLHTLCKGSLPGKGVKRPRAEMYDQRRYFTVTGKPYGEPKPLREAQKELCALYEELTAETKKAPDKPPREPKTYTPPSGDKDFLSIGLEKDNKLRSLWDGARPNGNESSDDQALMNKLAYWCNRDPEIMKAAFLSSPHAAGKDEAHLKKLQREDYLTRTIETALASGTKTAAEDHESYHVEIVQKSAAQKLQNAAQLSDYQGGQLSIPVVEAALRAFHIQVRFNLLTKETEYTGIPSRFSTNNAPNTMPTFLRDSIKCFQIKNATTQSIAECLYCIADMNRYNPVEEFLNAGAWDGVDRLGEIYRILGITEEKYKTYVRKWMIQCVALGLNEETVPIGAEGVLVLQGAQGLAKTSFFRIITPFPEWFVEGATVDVENKDTLINALKGLITELGELESVIRRDQPALKAFITSPKDSIRPPYGKTAVTSPRRTSFCGTVNPDDFLRDETGSRRFWTIPVTEIDKETLFSLSRSWVFQLWYQIHEEWKKNPAGFRLTPEEMTRLQKDNEAFSTPLPFEIEIREMLDFSLPVSEWCWWKASDLAARLTTYGKPTARSVGKALRKIQEQWIKDNSSVGLVGQNLIRAVNGCTRFLIPLQKNW